LGAIGWRTRLIALAVGIVLVVGSGWVANGCGRQPELLGAAPVAH